MQYWWISEGASRRGLFVLDAVPAHQKRAEAGPWNWVGKGNFFAYLASGHCLHLAHVELQERGARVDYTVPENGVRYVR